MEYVNVTTTSDQRTEAGLTGNRRDGGVTTFVTINGYVAIWGCPLPSCDELRQRSVASGRQHCLDLTRGGEELFAVVDLCH